MSQYTASDPLLVGFAPKVLDTVIAGLLEVKSTLLLQSRYLDYNFYRDAAADQLQAWDELGLESHKGKAIVRGTEVKVELSRGPVGWD